MKRIALIGATGIDWWENDKKKQFVVSLTPPGYEIKNFQPRYGTYSIESHSDEAYNSPFILEQVVRANKEGYDAIVIDCVCDPILEAAREVSEIPVIGPRNAAIHLALVLGTRFSIVTVQGESLVKCMESGMRKEGLEGFCASIRYLKMPVLEISRRPDAAQMELLELVRRIIKEDGANVIVLGCTALSHEVDIGAIMKDTGVPILDPFVVAIRTAAMLVEIGLSHSKIAYPLPPRKPIVEVPSLKGAFDDIIKD